MLARFNLRSGRSTIRRESSPSIEGRPIWIAGCSGYFRSSMKLSGSNQKPFVQSQLSVETSGGILPPHRGRGGWTWYTGAAGWLYRLGIEGILGITRKGDRLMINPCIPESWREFGITIRYDSSVYHIHVENPEGISSGIISVEMDGEYFTNGDIPLVDNQAEHDIRVIMG